MTSFKEHLGPRLENLKISPAAGWDVDTGEDPPLHAEVTEHEEVGDPVILFGIAHTNPSKQHVLKGPAAAGQRLPNHVMAIAVLLSQGSNEEVQLNTSEIVHEHLMILSLLSTDMQMIRHGLLQHQEEGRLNYSFKKLELSDGST